MLEFTGINYWAIFLIWLLYMAVGAFWYSSAGFAKQWAKYTGIDITKIPQKKATRILIAVALSCLIQAFVLVLILHSLDVSTVLDAVIVSVVLWLGLTTATTVGVTLYSNHSWKFLWLNSSYFLVVMTLAAVIFSLLR